jgi:hypothetical protein
MMDEFDFGCKITAKKVKVRYHFIKFSYHFV